MNEYAIGTEAPCCFEEVNRAQSVNFKVQAGDIAGPVVRGLSRTMNNQVEFFFAKQTENACTIANVDVSMLEACGR